MHVRRALLVIGVCLALGALLTGGVIYAMESGGGSKPSGEVQTILRCRNDLSENVCPFEDVGRALCNTHNGATRAVVWVIWEEPKRYLGPNSGPSGTALEEVRRSPEPVPC